MPLLSRAPIATEDHITRGRDVIKKMSPQTVKGIQQWIQTRLPLAEPIAAEEMPSKVIVTKLGKRCKAEEIRDLLEATAVKAIDVLAAQTEQPLRFSLELLLTRINDISFRRNISSQTEIQLKSRLTTKIPDSDDKTYYYIGDLLIITPKGELVLEGDLQVTIETGAYVLKKLPEILKDLGLPLNEKLNEEEQLLFETQFATRSFSYTPSLPESPQESFKRRLLDIYVSVVPSKHRRFFFNFLRNSREYTDVIDTLDLTEDGHLKLKASFEKAMNTEGPDTVKAYKEKLLSLDIPIDSKLSPSMRKVFMTALEERSRRGF